MTSKTIFRAEIKKVGRTIKKIRTSKGLSLRQLATLSNIDHSDIGKIERGLNNLTFTTLLKLAIGLEVDILFLGEHGVTPIFSKE